MKEFRCIDCGGTVKMLPATTERRWYRGAKLEIPSGTPIPKCDCCGETYFSPNDGARIDALLRKKRTT